MANDKLGNLLKFTEYDHLQLKQKPTSRTEIGGFAVLEGLSVKELLSLAKARTGKSKKDLKDLSPKKLKKLAYSSTGTKLKDFQSSKIEKDTKDDKDDKDVKEKDDEKDEKKNENFLFEKKSSAKQKAARARFMEMIQSKKKGKSEGDKEPKKGFPFTKKK